MPFESKWSLKMLREEYERTGIDFDDIFNKIKELCLKTLICVEQQSSEINVLRFMDLMSLLMNL